MSECPRSRELIEAIVEGMSASEIAATFETHAATCRECGSVLAAHRELERMGADVAEPSEADFAAARASVLTALGPRSERRATGGFWRELATLVRARPLGAGAVAAVVLAAGALLGRASTTPPMLDDAMLLRAMTDEARGAHAVASYWDGRFTYSNVSVRPAGGDRLSLRFDACRHMEVVTTRESALAKEVLLHAIVEPSPLNTRLEAVALATETGDRTLREGVIIALHHDPELAVRLAALETLGRVPFDDTVRAALLRTLGTDPAVQMRLEALEMLEAKQVSADLLRRTIVDAGLETDPAVLERARGLLRDL
jgi:hypothetical protein